MAVQSKLRCARSTILDVVNVVKQRWKTCTILPLFAWCAAPGGLTIGVLALATMSTALDGMGDTLGMCFVVATNALSTFAMLKIWQQPLYRWLAPTFKELPKNKNNAPADRQNVYVTFNWYNFVQAK